MKLQLILTIFSNLWYNISMKKLLMSLAIVVLILPVFVLGGCLFRNPFDGNTFVSRVEGISMYPTVHDGASVTVRRTQDVNRSDIIVHSFSDYAMGDIYLLKRVIGIGGDHITFVQAEHYGYYIYLNSFRINEYYVGGQYDPVPRHIMTFVNNNDFTIIVPYGHIFVMGDNRPVSWDSRAFGYVCVSTVLGIVFEIRN